MLIYRHLCVVTGKSYVGFTTRELMLRWQEHVNATKKGSTLTFHRAIRKHGPEAWEHSVLQECDSVFEMLAAEKYWIRELDALKNGYNSTEGGDGVVGYTFTKDDRRKMSIAKRGKNNPHFGKPRSKTTREKIAVAQRGHRSHLAKLTEEQVNQIREIYAQGGISQHRLAEQFDVTQSTISRLIRGVTHGSSDT